MYKVLSTRHALDYQMHDINVAENDDSHIIADK